MSKQNICDKKGNLSCSEENTGLLANLETTARITASSEEIPAKPLSVHHSNKRQTIQVSVPQVMHTEPPSLLTNDKAEGPSSKTKKLQTTFICYRKPRNCSNSLKVNRTLRTPKSKQISLTLPKEAPAPNYSTFSRKSSNLSRTRQASRNSVGKSREKIRVVEDTIMLTKRMQRRKNFVNRSFNETTMARSTLRSKTPYFLSRIIH